LQKFLLLFSKRSASFLRPTQKHLPSPRNMRRLRRLRGERAADARHRVMKRLANDAPDQCHRNHFRIAGAAQPRRPGALHGAGATVHAAGSPLVGGHGAELGKDQRLGYQALVMSYVDGFWIIGIGLVVASPLVLFLKRPPGAAAWRCISECCVATAERKRSFLKKRTKKLLLGCRGVVGDSRVKVFASFFKKKRFLKAYSRAAAKAPA
jgi:hypothetical protein